MTRVLQVGIITVLWLVLWRDASVANALSGLVVAVVVTFGVARAPIRPVRPLATIGFLTWFAWKLVEANLVLAREVVTPRNRIRTGIVAVPMVGASDLLVTVVANAISLTPGTLTLEVRRAPEPVAYVHVLHLRDVDHARLDALEMLHRAARALGEDIPAPATTGAGWSGAVPMIAVAHVLLAVAAAGFVARLLIGPSLADRIIALDGLLLIAISSLTVEAARTGESFFIDAVVAVGLLGFVGTAVAARFVERRGA